MNIVESATGIWFYHLAEKGVPICGSTGVMMPTELDVSTWGLKTHIREKYCAECTRLNNER